MRSGAILLLLIGVLGTPSAVHADDEPSVARQWMDLLLDSITDDYARPVVHARNLFHLSAVMWNAWAIWEDGPSLWQFGDEFHLNEDVAAARREAISYAAYRLLMYRFANSPGFEVHGPRYTQKMIDLGYDPSFTDTVGADPAAVGNWVGMWMIVIGMNDGANELGDYVNSSYLPVNEPLVPPLPGPQVVADPNRWQPMALEFFVDQAGNVIVDGYPEFLGPEWGGVLPFALDLDDCVINTREDFNYLVYHDPGAPPQLNTSTEQIYLEGFEQVLIWSSHLDASNPVMWDISPNSIGNAELPTDPAEFPDFYNYFDGGDAGQGYAVNPVTGEGYEEQWVSRGDYTRVLAEFWADGPESKTPPGHWFLILNYVNDHPLFTKRLGGEGPVLDELEWDVKAYFAMGGCMHDAAVASWGVKGWYDYVRPITAIRWMAEQGQRTNPLQSNYHPQGLRLLPGLVEVLTEKSTALGERHEHLAGKKGENIGKIAAYCWRGPNYIKDPDIDAAGVGWILVENWWPYQRPSFVTPPFAGYVSGHSTFSRSGAELMSLLTGSQYFPGGLGEFHAEQNEFLVFEEGPSVGLTLQWASYFDASDQCSLSRIFGGIHPPADDLPGRIMGTVIGPNAWSHAGEYFGPEPGDCPADINNDGVVDGGDLGILLAQWSCAGSCTADVNADGLVDGSDLGAILASWEYCGG